jgi:hypothetical protein
VFRGVKLERRKSCSGGEQVTKSSFHKGEQEIYESCSGRGKI